MIKINIKDAKKMWVWGNNINIKAKRWIMCEVEDGYLGLKEGVNPDNYMEFWSPFVIFRRAEKIKEFEWRAFKRGEMPAEYVNYIYRKKYLVSQQFRPVGYDSDSISQLRFYDGWLNNIEVFDEREVSKDNGKTWEPVGVRE